VQWFDGAVPIGAPCAGLGNNQQCCVTVAPGTYTARVTDANGCIDEDPATLGEVPDPSCDVVSTPTRFCDGGSAQLCAEVTGGTAPFTYLWSPGGSTSDCINVTDDTVYTVTVTDDNGCVTTCTGAAIVHPNPDCTVRVNPSTPQCEGTPVELCADVTGGTAPYTYQWSPGGANTSCITVTLAGNYSVIVTDANGCTTDCNATVTYIECGGEGCTPGYWKQPHHFSDWTAPYVPNMLFSNACAGAVCFENAFPGKTLLTVLSQGGAASPGPNSLNNLGRHTVAALLNAANGGVDYPFSALEVINMFNAVYPGNDTAYNNLKSQFSSANEAGCPLNGHADSSNDGLVNSSDLLVVLNNWGGSGAGDINHDGVVNVADMMAIITWWGS
jgi:hypothetical protein